MIPRNCFGRILNMKQRGNRGEDIWKQFTVNNYSQEKCQMEDGSPSHYITCKAIKEPGVIINLHPDYVMKIFTGEDPSATVEGMAIIDQTPTVVVTTAEVVPPVPSPKNGKLKGPGIKPIKDTKKQRAYEIFGQMYRTPADKNRIIQAFEDRLSMTERGATTYYYNCKKDRI
jgi:hypothetical protein